MPAPRLYDWEWVAEARSRGEGWEVIARRYPETTPRRLCSGYASWRKRERDAGRDPGAIVVATARGDESQRAPGTDHQNALLTRADISRITSLEDLLVFFKVDVEAWEVERFRVNKTEQGAKLADAVVVTPLYHVRADLVRNRAREEEAARLAIAQALDDISNAAPVRGALPRLGIHPADEPCLFVCAVQDAHIGMLAWGDETGGENYDLSVAVGAYGDAVSHLLSTTRNHPVERILYLVGNDLIHIDHLTDGKVGVTTRGTPQDYDTRLSKIFTAARRATVEGIDRARDIAPVDVVMVGGNHDRATTYKLGEVLQAWYRDDPEVSVDNRPRARKYYEYHRLLLGLTHGEEFKRARDPLPLIMATEAPEAWARSRQREWLTGHFHAVGELQYMTPRKSTVEARGVRVRSLPGLTAGDAWHTEAGYAHQRAATALVYRRSGRPAGLYEFHP